MVVGGGFEDIRRWDLGLGFLILGGCVVVVVGICLEGWRVEILVGMGVVVGEVFGLEGLREYDLREVEFGVRERRGGDKGFLLECKGVIVDFSLKGIGDFGVEGDLVKE